MIDRKYPDSTRRQNYSESIDTFSKYDLIQWDLLMFSYFQKMIGRKYQASTRRQHYSESIDTFQNIVWFIRIYLCFNIFRKMIVRKYPDSTPERLFENAWRYQSFLGGDSPNKYQKEKWGSACPNLRSVRSSRKLRHERNNMFKAIFSCLF